MVTISLLILLTVIAVGLLSLSSITLRASGASRATQEARSNARLALMLAIGELQKYAGPDQRVTADADIIRDAAPEMRHLMGVWSTEEWNPEKPGKNRKLLAWMASVPLKDPHNPSPEDVQGALRSFKAAGSELVTLVGPGSLGKASDEADHVRVATIPVQSESGAVRGSCAYWVRGEASRASYAVPTEKNPQAWNAASYAGVATRTGLETVDDKLFDGYRELVQGSAGDAPSTRSMDILHPARPKASQRYFHDLTNRSLSLLTNTRHGGDKWDLSTAFELDDDEFNRLTVFHDSSERNLTNAYSSYGSSIYNKPEFYPQSHPLGYLFVIPATSPDFRNLAKRNSVVRGPTWDLLRNHYRIYKRNWEHFDWPRGFAVSDEAFAARGALPLSYSAFGWGFEHRSPGSWFHRNFYDIDRNGQVQPSTNLAEPILDGAYPGGGRWVDERFGFNRDTAARVQPMVIRITLVVGLRKMPAGNSASSRGAYKIVLSLDPYVTIANPYNRAIEFESLALKAVNWNPLRFSFIGKDSQGKDISTEERRFGNSRGGNRGSIALYLPPPSRGLYRLGPGEVKVLSPTIRNGTRKFKANGITKVDLSFAYTENSGLYSEPFPGPEIIPAGSITVEVFGRTSRGGLDGQRWADRFLVLQVSPRSHRGARLPEDKISIFDPDLRDGGYGDAYQQPFMAWIGYNTKDPDVGGDRSNNRKHDFYFKQTHALSQIPLLGRAGNSLAALDLRMKNGAEDTPVFHQFSPRGQLFDPRVYDTTNRISPAWICKILPVNDMSEIGMVGEPDGQAYWGNGTTSAYGTPKVVLFDLPWAPMTSLGSLSSADITVISPGAACAIGNSFPNPGLRDLTKIIGRRRVSSRRQFFAKVSTGPQALADYSWAANEALWDQYFFSGINWGKASLAFEGDHQTYASQQEAIRALVESARTGESPLSNPRMLYLPGNNPDPGDELADFSKIARHLAVIGGFNVNSTSVDAWAAVLAAHRDEKIRYLRNSGSLAKEKSGASFSRFSLPAGNSGDIWSGFRKLDDDEIRSLAEAIVEQVKIRGPFMGMADFTNRRLTKASVKGFDIGKLGALQMAIESAGLNDSIKSKGRDANLGNMENKSIGLGGGSRMKVNTLTGLPGYLMQADILTTMGSILRTRSDTFLIRCYGDAKDAEGKVLARAWCEATIQRTPDWMVPTDEPFKTMIPVDARRNLRETPILKQWKKNDKFPEINLRYGRKMRIVSFRWLSADEI